jgi:glutathione-specific gamma-glutamylcyclotransferase
VTEVKEYLDIREINGYTIHYTPFHPADGTPTIRTLVYIGTPQNDQFTGVQEPQILAEHISKTRGPSGLNTDYLFSLEEALADLGPESGDEHVTDLSNRVRTVLECRGQSVVAEADAETAGAPARSWFKNGIMSAPLPVSEEPVHFQQDHSVEEQEETEKID